MRKVLRDTIIIIAISLGLLVVSETILRIVFPEKIITRSKNLAYEFNEDYLLSLRPNIKKTFLRQVQNGGDIIQWKTNNDSFRGDELRNNPQVRIMVYGDSNIQARFSNTENTVVYKLGEYLKKDGIKDIEVVNAGIIGFGPDQSLIKFKKEADTYKPNLVIFHIFADNDFGDILRNRLYELDANHNLIEADYRRTVDDHLIYERQLDFVSSLLIIRETKKLAQLIKGNEKEDKGNEKEDRLNLLQKLVEEEFSVYKAKKYSKYSGFSDHYDLDLALDPDKESSKTKIKLMEAVLKTANIVARSKGIKFLVLIQPSVIDLTKGNTVLNYEYLEKYPKYRRTNLTDAVKNICVENNIHYINLYEAFMRNDPENLFFRAGDNHWNDQGQDIAAKETASYITSRMMPKKE